MKLTALLILGLALGLILVEARSIKRQTSNSDSDSSAGSSGDSVSSGASSADDSAADDSASSGASEDNSVSEDGTGRATGGATLARGRASAGIFPIPAVPDFGGAIPGEPAGFNGVPDKDAAINPEVGRSARTGFGPPPFDKDARFG